jgi:hypothetical protein
LACSTNGFLLGLLLYPEDGGDILLRNIGLSANYAALPVLSRRWRRYTPPKHRAVCELHSVACSIMKMEAIYSSETSGCLRTTQRRLFYHEDGGDILLRNIGHTTQRCNPEHCIVCASTSTNVTLTGTGNLLLRVLGESEPKFTGIKGVFRKMAVGVLENVLENLCFSPLIKLLNNFVFRRV